MSYDDLTAVNMTITGPAGPDFDPMSVGDLVRRLVRDDVDTFMICVQVDEHRYEADVALRPRGDQQEASSNG